MAATVESNVHILDPFKKQAEFRDYKSSKNAASVRETYRQMHESQTVAFVQQMHDKFIKKGQGKRHTIWELMEKLDFLVDESDPDIEASQTVHAFQTAEALREKYPNDDWLHLTGFLHDVGKIIALPEFGGLPQWAVVGDTFPVGCAPSEVIVHHDTFAKNTDCQDPRYNTKLGIYTEHCGLDKVMFSFGHDEYMYHLLKRNNCKLPAPAFAIIRLHSFYPWHTHGGYSYLCDNSDEEKLAWVRKFNECDLYSKSDLIKPDPVALRPYYDSLISKYFDSPYLEI